MGWLSDLFKKSEGDPATTASQKQAADLMAKISGGAPLPALPSMMPAQQGLGNMPAINPNPVGLPAYLGGGQKTVFPAGLPNQLSMIANQLSAGGYGTPVAISQQLSGIYKPVTVAPQLAPKARGFTAQAAPVAAPAAAPAFPWQEYARTHPGIHKGPNYTFEAEGMRAWKDYVARGAAWKKPGYTGEAKYASPL